MPAEFEKTPQGLTSAAYAAAEAAFQFQMGNFEPLVGLSSMFGIVGWRLRSPLHMRVVTSLAIGLCLLAWFVPVSVQAQAPILPHAFFGDIEMAGTSAPVNTQVEARGTGVLTGISGNPIFTTQAGKYGGPTAFEPKLVVQGNVTNGAAIEFYINGVKAECAIPGGAWQNSFAFAAGNVTQLNLRVGQAAPAPDIPTPTRTPTMTPTRTSVPTRTATLTVMALTSTPTATYSATGEPTGTPTATSLAGEPTDPPTATRRSPALRDMVTPTNVPAATLTASPIATSAARPTIALTVSAAAPTGESGVEPPPSTSTISVATVRPLPAVTSVLTLQPVASSPTIAATRAHATPILAQKSGNPGSDVSSMPSEAQAGKSRLPLLWAGLTVIGVVAIIGVIFRLRRMA